MVSSKFPSILFFTFVYAKCTRRERLSLWEDISQLGISSLEPWCIGGDFNIITNAAERQGGSQPNIQAMADFGKFILEEGLLDLGYTGSPFTWERPDGLKQRLDRVLVNSAWSSLLSATSVSHGILRHSDHRALNVNIQNGIGKKKQSI